jgi:hypothetical protein
MALAAKGPPRQGSADGPIDAVCLLSSSAADVQTNSPPQRPAQAELLRNPRAVREAKRLLKLEFLHECAGGISVHAGLVQTFAEIGDAAGACYALRQLFAHAKAAPPIYLELRDDADDGGRAMNGAPFPRHSHLQLVPAPPPRPRRLDVRIVVSAPRLPIGRSRAFRLTESDIELLIAAAMRLEARRA